MEACISFHAGSICECSLQHRGPACTLETSRHRRLALAGVGVCGPIVTLITSFASWIGVGERPL